MTSQNTPPAAAIDNQSVDIDEWVPLQTLMTASDADNDVITQYQFYDAGAAAGSGYFWTADIGQQPADTNITVNAADLGTTWVRGGQMASTDLMWVRAFDGTDWSAWDPFTLTTMA